MGDGDMVIEELRELLPALRKRVELEVYFAGEWMVGTLAAACADQKQAEAALLLEQVKACRNCSLSRTRTNVVFGEGSLEADIVFVGEAPGRDEDLSGKPFVGVAGGLLTKIIQAMGLQRKDVYITNVLRCRPPGNRNPLPEEVARCRPFLLKLLKIIKPKVICTLGKFAAQALLNDTRPISRLRGQFFEFEGIKLMPTYHPAYLLRNPLDKKLVWQDMKKLIAYLKDDKSNSAVK